MKVRGEAGVSEAPFPAFASALAVRTLPLPTPPLRGGRKDYLAPFGGEVVERVSARRVRGRRSTRAKRLRE